MYRVGNSILTETEVLSLADNIVNGFMADANSGIFREPTRDEMSVLVLGDKILENRKKLDDVVLDAYYGPYAKHLSQ